MISSSSGTSNSAALGTPLTFTRVQPEWEGDICVCVGSGPSLSEDDLLYCRQHKTRMIAVNDAIWLAPWAVLYAPDGKWWWENRDAVWPTRSITIDPAALEIHPGVELLNYRSGEGLSLDPTTIMTGGHGGYQAINLAAHFRPRRIVLLGYDMQAGADGRHHFFGDHRDGSHVNYEYKLGVYHALSAPLTALGIEIVNASRVSAIDAFPRVSLADAVCR